MSKEEDPIILEEQEKSSKQLASFLKRHNVEVDYCTADWRDTKDLIENAHAMILKHPDWLLHYFGGDIWGIDANFVFFTSRPVPEELLKLVGDYIVEMGAELPEEVAPPKPVCPKCGKEISTLVGYYTATVTGFVDLVEGTLRYWLSDGINDLKDIIDTDTVSWCCPLCNEKLFGAGEECEDDILALLKCESEGVNNGRAID